MNMKDIKYLLRNVGFIVSLSFFLAIVYNHFSTKGIPLIRKEIQKIEIADSILFSHSGESYTAKLSEGIDTSIPANVKVIAPLHEQALRNQDSMAKLYPSKRDEPKFKVINLLQLKRLLTENRGLLFDARNEDDYKKGHIKNAKNIPAIGVDQHFAELAQIPRDTLITIYCNGPDCHLAYMLADFLKVMEFNNILLYDDGWEGWTKANMPIDTTMVEKLQ